MITVTILTKNSSKTLQATLESTRDFPEVLIFDSGSTDDTLALAQTFPNVTVQQHPFIGFGPMHNEAARCAKYDWILSLDSDEILSPELRTEIQALKLDPSCVYAIPRHNYFNGKHIKWCGGWHPDDVLRLYHRKSTRFNDNLVHEKVLVENLKTLTLQNPMLHTPYREIGDFLSKMQHYTTLFAEQEKLKSPFFFSILLHSGFAFFKSYFLKGGFLGGKEGFIISAYNAHTTLYKYLKLAEKKKS